MTSDRLPAGLGDAPWPPHYAKQAGEPPRVQPSRQRRPTEDYATREAEVEREKKTVRVNEFITVSELAQILKTPAVQIVGGEYRADRVVTALHDHARDVSARYAPPLPPAKDADRGCRARG